MSKLIKVEITQESWGERIVLLGKDKSLRYDVCLKDMCNFISTHAIEVEEVIDKDIYTNKNHEDIKLIYIERGTK